MRPIVVNRPMGPLMVGVVSLVAILLILSTVATQRWIDVLRRDNEAEMIFRAKEIVRGLQRYQKDRGAFPTDLEMLMEPGSKGQYFMRRLYDDPLVADGKWGLLYAAPGGGVFDPNAPQPENVPGGGSFINEQSTPGVNTMVQGIGGAAQGAQGLPIAGVKTLCTDEPFRHYNDLNDYSMWLFTVFDQRQQAAGTGTGQVQPGGVNAPRPTRQSGPRSGSGG